MEVQMPHALAGLLADVGHHTVALQAQLLGHIGDDLKDMGNHSAVARANFRPASNRDSSKT